MAITKFERWKTSEKNADDLAKEGNGIFDKPIYEEESPAIQLLHDKVHELTDLINTHITKMAANDAKTGITTQQADAITTNTAKTGITTKQATAITNNSNNIDAKMTVIPNQDYTGVQSLRAGVVLNKDKSYSLVFSYAEVTPRGTTTRTGSIQLK